MNSDEATVRGHLKSRFESTFEERVQRALEVRPQIIIPPNQDLFVLVDVFAAQNIVSAACADAMRRVLRSFRNDFHHLNPSISNVPVQEIAKRNIEDIGVIEKEIFEHTYANGTLSPKQDKYWDVRADGTMPVSLRFG